LIVVATHDLIAQADGKMHISAIGINSQNGQLAWKTSITNITGLQAGDPNPLPNFTNQPRAEVVNGWPVVAEQHGLVMIKLRLNTDTLWTWSPWPTNNTAIRSNLTSRPDQQALIVLNLSDGSQAFIANLGHGGYGDGFLPMGPQPVVKKFADGTETVYTVIRGDNRFDGRWDSHFGEMLLDDTTVQGYLKGYVRWIQYGNYGWPTNSNNDTPPTDEQANPIMSGDYFLAGHWATGNTMQILDRSSSRGTYGSPITSSPLPHIVTTTTTGGCSNTFSLNHYCSGMLIMDIPNSEWRAMPNGGFYIYWNQGKVYESYWSDYATYVVSNNTVYFRSSDGAIIALEHGNP
jgi:hypothetical protein